MINKIYPGIYCDPFLRDLIETGNETIEKDEEKVKEKMKNFDELKRMLNEIRLVNEIEIIDFLDNKKEIDLKKLEDFVINNFDDLKKILKQKTKFDDLNNN